MTLKTRLARFQQLLFPDYDIYARKLPLYQGAGLLLLFFLIFYMLGTLIPANGFFAFDWVHFFGKGEIPKFYPPWTGFLMSLFNWPGLIGITLAAVALASLTRSVHPLSLAMPFLTLPVLWTLFLGQLDGLVLLGLMGLPYLVPLALLKPQIAIWGLGAKPASLAAALGILIVSFIIWGFWPSHLVDRAVVTQGQIDTNIALGLAGLPVAAILMWFSRGDIDMLMLAGTFVTPYFLPYSLLVVSPAISRLKPSFAVIACLLSWLPLSANWLGPAGWWLGWVFIAWLWGCLAAIRYRSNLERWLARIQRRSESAPASEG